MTSPRFKHDLLEEHKLKRVEVDGKRRYLTPSNESYPSITTILSSLSKEGIKRWIQKVGKEEAEKIKTKAASRGTRVHKLCEDYLWNKDDYLNKAMPTTVEQFKHIQSYLDKHVELVRGIELPLYSDELKVAGTCDLFCTMHGTPVVVDFKTSSKIKKEEWIEGYFLQSTAYALMIEERYNIKVPAICIVISVEDEGLQTFIKNTSEYVDKTRAVIQSYHANEL